MPGSTWRTHADGSEFAASLAAHRGDVPPTWLSAQPVRFPTMRVEWGA